MYNIFFILLSVDEHLSFFHVFVIVNSVAMNIWVHVVFELESSSDMCPGVGLVDHMKTLFLIS